MERNRDLKQFVEGALLNMQELRSGLKRVPNGGTTGLFTDVSNVVFKGNDEYIIDDKYSIYPEWNSINILNKRTLVDYEISYFINDLSNISCKIFNDVEEGLNFTSVTAGTLKDLVSKSLDSIL